MKSELAHTKVFRLSKHLKVEITAGAGGLVCEWIPGIPNFMSSKEVRAYRAARDEMLSRLNVPVLVVEVAGGVNERP